MKVGDRVFTKGILIWDREEYEVLSVRKDGGLWCKSISHPELEAEGKIKGFIDKKGILLFEDMVELK